MDSKNVNTDPPLSLSILLQSHYANNTMGGSPEAAASPTEPGGASECRLFTAITSAGAATAAHAGPTTR